jgi:hypothetical protein
LEHVALNRGDVAVESKGPAYDACEVDYNTIVAGSSVVGELDVAESEEAAVFVLEDFNSDWVEGGPPGCPSCRTGISLLVRTARNTVE